MGLEEGGDGECSEGGRKVGKEGCGRVDGRRVFDGRQRSVVYHHVLAVFDVVCRRSGCAELLKDALDGDHSCGAGEGTEICADVAWSRFGEEVVVKVAGEAKLGHEYS